MSAIQSHSAITTSLSLHRIPGMLLLNLMLAALLGVVLRYQSIETLEGLPYQYLLHAHSHLAMMGWASPLLAGMIVWKIVPNTPHMGTYMRLFSANLMIVFLMTLAFLYQGYAGFSIVFATLHQLVMYIWAFYVLRDLRAEQSHSLQIILSRVAIYSMLIGSIALWVLPAVIVLLGRDHTLFQLTIQFFLHGHFYGWFTFGALSGLSAFLFVKGATPTVSSRFVPLLIAIIFATFFIGLPAKDSLLIRLIAVAGSTLYLTAVVLLIKRILDARELHFLIKLGIVSLVVQALLQLVAATGLVDSWIQLRHVKVGYLHLTTLGTTTMILGGIFLTSDQDQPFLAKGSWLLVVIGYVLQELSLLGSPVWSPIIHSNLLHTILFISSLLILTGTCGLAFLQLSPKKKFYPITQ